MLNLTFCFFKYLIGSLVEGQHKGLHTCFPLKHTSIQHKDGSVLFWQVNKFIK